MSEQGSDSTESAQTEPAQVTPVSGTKSWRAMWQIPVLLVATALLAFGLMRAISSKPEPDHQQWIIQAQDLIEAREYELAISTLNEHLFPYESRGELPADIHASYHLLLGRSIGMGQRKLGISREENHRNIVESIAEARSAGADLTIDDLAMVVESLGALGRIERALEWLDRIPPSSSARRVRLLKALIDFELEASSPDQPRLISMLASLAREPAVSADDRIWSAARQARMLIAGGEYRAAVDRLLRELQRVDLTRPSAVSLYMELAEAYLLLGEPGNARTHLRSADSRLAPRDAARPRFILLSGRAADALGEYEGARDAFGELVREFPASPESLSALMGLGQILELQGDIRGSLDAYRDLVDAMSRGLQAPDVTTPALTDLLIRHSSERIERGEHDQALAYAALAERLFPEGRRPPEVLLAMAIAHRGVGDDLLAVPRSNPLGPEGITALNPVAREDARRALIAAGSYFEQHATMLVLRDPAAHVDSLWNAAIAFDDAGFTDRSIALLHSFNSSYPTDPRNADSRFRLATAYNARGEYRQAASIYRALIEEAEEGGMNLGAYPVLSHVPLAQCLLADGDDATDDEADAILRRVVGGGIVADPNPRLRRDALAALARRRLDTGGYLEAAARFQELLDRFPTSPDSLLSLSGLADANRLEARRMSSLLETPLTIDDQQRYEQQRVEHLTLAREAYDRVIREAEAKGIAITSAERETLRNAYLFRGACVYDLGDLRQAILYYDAAAQRYPEDPASLVALVQMVNAYVEMGDFASARVQHQRARRMFEKFPDNVWDDPYLPMGRVDWERWLASTGEIYAAEAGRE